MARLDVDGPDHPVLGGVDGELDDPGHWAAEPEQVLPGELGPGAALVAEQVWPLPGLAGEAAAGDTPRSGETPPPGRAPRSTWPCRAPRISTPPMPGLTALRTSAVFMGSWPTSAVKG